MATRIHGNGNNDPIRLKKLVPPLRRLLHPSVVPVPELRMKMIDNFAMIMYLCSACFKKLEKWTSPLPIRITSPRKINVNLINFDSNVILVFQLSSYISFRNLDQCLKIPMDNLTTGAHRLKNVTKRGIFTPLYWFCFFTNGRIPIDSLKNEWNQKIDFSASKFILTELVRLSMNKIVFFNRKIYFKKCNICLILITIIWFGSTFWSAYKNFERVSHPPNYLN